MTAADERDLGVLLVLLLVMAMLVVAVGVVFEVRQLFHALMKTRKFAAILRSLPQQDPPDGTKEFYDVQIPVEEDNMGDAFEPKAPEALVHLSSESKLKVVQLLTAENEQRLEHFFHKLSHHPTIPLVQVNASSLVTQVGIVCAKCSKKTEESILAKACRPVILAKNPKFGIEHIRDTFRFKAVVFSFSDAVEFILAMHKDHRPVDRCLCPGGGLSSRNVAKLDVVKLKTPKEWGWRYCVALRLINCDSD